MKLKSFEVRSYRSCIKTTLSLNPELTVLIGINSAGKSNILNAILLLRKLGNSRYAFGLEKKASLNQCQIAAKLQRGDRNFAVKGDIVFDTDERNIDEIQDSDLKWKLPEFEESRKWQAIPYAFVGISKSLGSASSRVMYPEKISYRQYVRSRKILEKSQQSLFEVGSFFNGIKYYSASQFSDPSRCPVSIELEEQRPLRRPRSFAGHEQFMLDLYRTWKGKGVPFKRYLSTVNKEGIGLVDDIEFTEFEMPSSSYEVRSGGKIKKIERNRLLVVPSFSIDGNTLSPNQLSEGTFKTLALLYYVLTDESNLLLIEEPEVCIHHGLLNSIIALIKAYSKQKQIVISTHSDFVLDQIAPEDLVLVTRQKNQGTTATPLSKTMSANDYRALRKYLEECGNLGEYWREGGLDDE